MHSTIYELRKAKNDLQFQFIASLIRDLAYHKYLKMSFSDFRTATVEIDSILFEFGKSIGSHE